MKLLYRCFLIALFSAADTRGRQIASYDPKTERVVIANVVQIPPWTDPAIEVPNETSGQLSIDEGPANPEVAEEENTASPSTSPTKSPSTSPTKSPTKAPTKAPTEALTKALTTSLVTPIECDGYFCDKTLSTMFLFMTHNSYAVRWEILSPNQNEGEGTQFDDGIRGFNWDVYYEGNGYVVVDHTPDGNTWTPKDYTDVVGEVMDRLERPEHRNEIVVVIFQHKKGGREANPSLVAPFGNKIITNYDSTKPFSYYIEKGQQVLMMGRYGEPSIGMHEETQLVTQNQYLWVDPSEEPNLAYRNGPRYSTTTAKLMNHFCGTSILDGGVGNALFSEVVNNPYRIMQSSRLFAQQDYAMGSLPNIIMVDFYETGDIWPAQELLRDRNDSFGDELEDGTRCVTGATCNSCYNPSSRWESKAMTACGSEPCKDNGSICVTWFTCDSCCAGANCPWYQFGICTCR